VTPAELSAAIVRILGTLQAAGDLPAGDLPTEVVIERPKNREHGDWATNIAMQAAGRFGQNPRALAEKIATES
jgi:arginyl-tRNA synthetase